MADRRIGERRAHWPCYKVLLVEDDADLRYLAAIFIDDDDEVRQFSNAEDVSDEDILWADVALVDYHLPILDGCVLLERVASVNPRARRILWTAAPPREPCEYAHRTLVKPNSLDDVQAVVRGR